MRGVGVVFISILSLMYLISLLERESVKVSRKMSAYCCVWDTSDRSTRMQFVDNALHVEEVYSCEGSSMCVLVLSVAAQTCED